MLDAALAVTQKELGDYRIDFTEEAISSHRKRDLTAAGDRINVDRFIVDNSTFKSGDHTLLIKVNYPLLQGYLGYRVPLIRKGTQHQFDGVKNLADLRAIKMGLGRGWEGWLYTQNGFSVIEPLGMTSLLKMLAAGRFDFVPLGAIEIQDEYRISDTEKLNLVAEKNLLIHYDFSPYFFVSGKQPLLAQRLEKGLKIIERDGTAKAIFSIHFKDRLKKLNFAKRTVIEIKNTEDSFLFADTANEQLDAYP